MRDQAAQAGAPGGGAEDELSKVPGDPAVDGDGRTGHVGAPTGAAGTAAGAGAEANGTAADGAGAQTTSARVATNGAAANGAAADAQDPDTGLSWIPQRRTDRPRRPGQLATAAVRAEQ